MTTPQPDEAHVKRMVELLIQAGPIAFVASQTGHPDRLGPPLVLRDAFDKALAYASTLHAGLVAERAKVAGLTAERHNMRPPPTRAKGKG